MAKNLNIDYARIARAAISHTNENGYRFDSHGAFLSLRSPQSSGLIKEMNPKVAAEGNRLSYKIVNGEPVAEVLIKMRPQRQATGKSNVRQTKANVIANANTEGAVIDVPVTYDIHQEYSEKFTQAQLMKLEPAAEKYLQAMNGKHLSLSMGEQQGLAEIGQRIMEKIDNAMFLPINLIVMNRLIASVGKNLADGSDALTLPTIPLYDADGRPKHDLLQWLNNVRRAHNIKGKLIVIGGTAVTNYFEKLQISGIQDLGIDAQKLLAAMPIEFYYDNQIDTHYGAGRILVRDAGAAALEIIAEHGDVIQATKVAATSYRRMSVSLSGFDTPTFTLDMDLRSIEVDEGAYPEIIIAPSFRAAIFTRPGGTLKAYGDWMDVTGVWGAIAA